MEPIHPLVIVGLTLLMMGIFGAMLWAMKWNSDRIERNEQAQRAAQAIPTAAASGAVPAMHRAAPASATQSAPDRLVPLPQWLDLVQNRLDDAPHTLIIGPSGTGKTTLVKALCATRRGQLFFVSPKPNAWPGLAYPTIDDDGGFTEIEAALQAVLTELRQRLTAMKRGTDPSTFPTLTIIVDEFPTIAEECATAPVLFRKLGQIGRELRLRLIPLSTTRQVKDLGIEGRGAARDNFAEITLLRSTARVSGLLRLAADDAPQTIALAGVLELSQQPIDPARWWIPPAAQLVPAASTPTPTTNPAWTTEHVRVAAWLSAEPTISYRELARRLWPEKDSGGDNSRKAKAIREAVEQVLVGCCEPVRVPVSTVSHSSIEEPITTSRLTATA